MDFCLDKKSATTTNNTQVQKKSGLKPSPGARSFPYISTFTLLPVLPGPLSLPPRHLRHLRPAEQVGQQEWQGTLVAYMPTLLAPRPNQI